MKLTPRCGLTLYHGSLFEQTFSLLKLQHKLQFSWTNGFTEEDFSGFVYIFLSKNSIPHYGPILIPGDHDFYKNKRESTRPNVAFTQVTTWLSCFREEDFSIFLYIVLCYSISRHMVFEKILINFAYVFQYKYLIFPLWSHSTPGETGLKLNIYLQHLRMLSHRLQIFWLIWF